MLSDDAMAQTIRVYFDGCNEADAAKMTSCLTDDAVHYFPPGMYGGPFVGAATIAQRWIQAVNTLGSVWAIDQLITDARTGRAAAEWTHFKTIPGTVLRGDEWYVFDAGSGLIAEIRAYYASPQAYGLDRLELGGFDYSVRGYALEPPTEPPVERSDTP